MKYNFKIPCVILARKKSKGIKNKNIQKLGTLSLVEHTIIYAKKSKYVDDIIVSTDDKKIAQISQKKKCITIFPRPANLSNDFAKTEPALHHALKYYSKNFSKIDIYAYLQVTEPFRPYGILDKCILNLIKNKKLDSSFAAYKMHKNFWTYKNKKYFFLGKKTQRNLPRQKKIPILREDTGVALASRFSVLKKNNSRIGNFFLIEPYEGLAGLIDIHDKNDLRLARLMLKNNLVN